jgi:hypothetical protein
MTDDAAPTRATPGAADAGTEKTQPAPAGPPPEPAVSPPADAAADIPVPVEPAAPAAGPSAVVPPATPDAPQASMSEETTPVTPIPPTLALDAPIAPAPEPPPSATSGSPLPPPAGRSGRGALGTVRSISVGLVFFLTCLSLVLATTTWWLHDTVLDTDRFVALTAPLASTPAVQDALVEATVTQVDQALNLGPVAQYVIAGIAREVYSSDAFAGVWENAMRFVHTQVVAILRGESNLAMVENGQVVVNLFPVIDRVLERINSLNLVIAGTTITVPDITNPDDPTASRAELSAALGRTLSPTFGVVPIADSTKLEAAQRAVTLFDAFVTVLFVVTALLALLTLALARRRIRMVALLGLGGLAALLAARLIISSAADGLATAVVGAGPGAIIGGQAVQQIADSYREFARVVLLIGLVAAVVATAAAWLLERRAGAEARGRGLTSVADGWFLALAGLVVALVALLLVGLTAATLLIVAAAYAIWLVVVLLSRRRAAQVAAA